MQTSTLITLLMVLMAMATTTEATSAAYFFKQDGQPKLVQDINDLPQGTPVIYGAYEDTLNTTGWGNLLIQTSGGDDIDQFYGAGYMEGMLTAERIAQNSIVLNAISFTNGTCPQQVADFLQQNDAWIRSKIATDKSPRWVAIGYLMAQFDGLVAGYANSQTSVEFPLTVLDFQLLQANGDLDDIIATVVPGAMPDWGHWPEKKVMEEFNRRSRCSSMVKVNGDLSSLLLGHSTWFAFSAMNRIYKSYNFNLTADFVATRAMSFSSYPGFLVSVDDFWIMDSGLGMTETTNSIFNTSLYSIVTPKSLLSWHRIRTANLMASSGKEWSDIIAQDNSGTYNNQYIIVDFKLFTPTKALQLNTLWIAEQIPGLVVAADMTRELERGHWPSYNVPYFYEIYERSGYNWMKDRLSDDVAANMDYQLAPRAKIFRRSNGNVTDYDNLGAFLRYNDYLNDPYSDGNPMNSICSRGDLSASPSNFGCIDTKVTSDVLIQKGAAWTVNGPTRSNGLPTFTWNGHEAWPHNGLPEEFAFPFVLQTNEGFSTHTNYEGHQISAQ